MNWYKELKKISQAFGTAPFGSSYLSDKSRSSPWGHAGGDEKTGIFEPSSGKHHANDYMSEEGQQSLVEKELEELKKKKNKKRKDLLLKKMRNKKKAQVETEVDCDLFETLNYEGIQKLIRNLGNELRKRGASEASHDMINMISATPLIEISIIECPDAKTPCDVKRNCKEDYDKCIPRIKGRIEEVLRHLKVSLSDALNDKFPIPEPESKTQKPEHQREYISNPKGLSGDWYRKIQETQRNNNLASIDSMPKEVLAEIMNRLAARLEEGKTKKANGLRGLLSFMPTLCASKNIKTASSIRESYNEAYSLFLKNAKIEIDKGLAILHKESQWGQSGPKMPTWRDSDWVTDTYHDIMGDGKGSEKGKELEPQKKQPKEQPKEQPVMEFLLKSTVTVNSVSESMQEIGSAFFIGKNLLLTCAHVVSGGTSAEAAMTIRFNHQEHEGIIIASDPLLDVAVISIKDKTFDSNDYLKMGDSGNLSPGEKIFTVGTPLGFENVVGEGIVSSTPVEYNDVGGNKKYMFISSNINPGNSGGPVIRQSDGTVIGIAAAVINTEEAGNAGLNAAIPIDDIKVFLRNNAIDFGETQNAV